jgi:hypothetical protein
MKAFEVHNSVFETRWWTVVRGMIQFPECT